MPALAASKVLKRLRVLQLFTPHVVEVLAMRGELRTHRLELGLLEVEAGFHPSLRRQHRVFFPLRLPGILLAYDSFGMRVKLLLHPRLHLVLELREVTHGCG